MPRKECLNKNREQNTYLGIGYISGKLYNAVVLFIL